MALFSISHFTEGAAGSVQPEITRFPSGHISVYYKGGVSISLTNEEAQQLIDGLTALFAAEAPAEEVAA